MARAPMPFQRLPQRNMKNAQKQLDTICNVFRQLMAQGRNAEALLEIRKAVQLAPKSAIVLSDAATAAVLASQYDEGVRYAKQGAKIEPKRINLYDAMAHGYGGLRDWENAGKAGLKALQLRDELYGSGALPELPDVQPKAGGKKIISFSLFGGRPEYCEPAVMNAQISKDIYPDWVCRFYVDDSVPAYTTDRLKQYGAEVVLVDEAAKSWPGTMWRFLAINDPEAAYVVFRDADSVVSQREAGAVNEWLASGKLFHTMRDSGSHTELVLAGLWGAVAGAVPDMRGKIEKFLSGKVESRHFADQYFLRSNIWPYIKQSLRAHDRLFGFYDATDFPNSQTFDYDSYHVGCDEARTTATAELAGVPDGTPMVWRLYTKILPLMNPDFSENVADEERLVCEYTLPVQGGKLAVKVPYRYARGFARNLTRVTVDKVK
ncbi:tetratricopeptide repeat protein [Neisseria perflava]|uniref:tetratricopeptide repeat protein n=1 Tax=Neisseria perflava TaxID=33053 RepID=UPI0020A0A7A3|nr:hypothetical protein [Neisseria perflava]MCP1659815.1 hypothetical protein [Neisseria perflava]MCP1773385.1 hypothetical protein [Neisseria perflava]